MCKQCVYNKTAQLKEKIMLTDTTRSPYAKVHALDGMKVKWTGGLWKERFDTCANSTVPQLKHMFDSKDISHVVENFKICAGDAQGDFDGTVFGDGDFYKWMESAIYTAYQTDNQLLKDEIENTLILSEEHSSRTAIFPPSRSLEKEAGTAFPEWEILTISRYTTSDICLQRPVYIKELQARTAFLQLQPEQQIIWSICMKRQNAQERFRLQFALPIIWDLWKCIVPLARNVI